MKMYVSVYLRSQHEYIALISANLNGGSNHFGMLIGLLREGLLEERVRGCERISVRINCKRRKCHMFDVVFLHVEIHELPIESNEGFAQAALALPVRRCGKAGDWQGAMV